MAKKKEANKENGFKIQARRIFLNRTMSYIYEETGISQETWLQYEAGVPVSKDDKDAVCEILEWDCLYPDKADPREAKQCAYVLNEKQRIGEKWPETISRDYGECAALSFFVGINALKNYIAHDITALSLLPEKTSIATLPKSCLKGELPKQFNRKYDIKFLCALRDAATAMEQNASQGKEVIPHTVADEIIIYLVAQISRQFFEKNKELKKICSVYDIRNWIEWSDEIKQDWDLEEVLYGDVFGCRIYPNIAEDSDYHFDNWFNIAFFRNSYEDDD